MKTENKWVPVLRFGALFAALLALCVTWIVLDDLFFLRKMPKQSVEIPDFRGSSVESLATDAWMDVKIEYRYDQGTPSGVILTQSPAAGSRRLLTAEHPRCEILLTVSLGEETVTIPNLSGANAREAEGRLREMGLRVRRTARRSAYPEGTVISITPRVGSVVPIGTETVLEISAGMPSETVTVPDLTGVSRQDALVRLWLAGLSVETVEEIDSELPAGCVARQSLPAGTRVVKGTKLRLFVSREIYDE